jgi:hypothetical protein
MVLLIGTDGSNPYSASLREEVMESCDEQNVQSKQSGLAETFAHAHAKISRTSPNKDVMK